MQSCSSMCQWPSCRRVGARSYPQATRRLDELGALTLSAISWLEVLQGMRNKAELLAVKKMLDKRSARLLPVTDGHHATRHRADGVAHLEPRAADGRCAHRRHRRRASASRAHRQRQALQRRRQPHRRGVRALRRSLSMNPTKCERSSARPTRLRVSARCI